MKARPLVSEVRPLMEQNQSLIQDRRMSWNQDPTQKQNKDQTLLLQEQVHSQNRNNQDQTQPPQVGDQTQQGLDQIQSPVEEEETSSSQQAHRPSPLKKKIQTTVESKRSLGPTARAAASHLNSSSGLRKAQSVQSLLTDTGKTTNPTRQRQTQSVRARAETVVGIFLRNFIWNLSRRSLDISWSWRT